MSSPTPFLDAVALALDRPAPLAALRTLASDELSKGTSRDALVDWVEAARERFPDKEDVLLELLDCLVGWCSPHMKIE